MNRFHKYALGGAALVAAVLGAPGSASALTTVYNPGQNGQYCVTANAYVGGATADGHYLNVVGYASASEWNNGGCDGAPAPENSVVMQASIWYAPPDGSRPFAVYSFPDNGAAWQYNTLDVWGVYLATLDNQSPLSGVNVADANFYGSGYYSLGVTAYVNTGNGWQGGTTYSPWQYASFKTP